MTSPRSELPDDLERCHDLIEQLQAELRAAGEARDAAEHIAHLEALVVKYQETIADQQQTIENLAADNALLKRSLFGCRRERYTDPAQTLLFDATASDSPEPDDEDEQPQKKKRTSKGRQPRVFPEFLPREEQRHYLDPEDIPEEMRGNPGAHRFFKKVGETLEMTPMQLKVVEQFQEVIALDRPDETTTMVAARRPVPLIQSFAGVSLLAYLTVSRFADHLPYYRLEDILARSGFRIDRSTQWRWMRGLGDGVTPLVDLMWERALQSSVLGMDETPVMELGGPGRTLKGYLWAGVGDVNHPYDCFFYTSDRRSIRAETMLAGFQGYLTADAYVAYERIGKLWPGVFKTSCWVHGRRKFEACHHLGETKQTRTALSYFRKLFDIEDLYRTSSDEVRLAARLKLSQPIVEGFCEWLEAERLRQLPKSKLTGAINYMLNRWESFTRFLESGAIPMDNNAAERALKYPILGRKAKNACKKRSTALSVRANSVPSVVAAPRLDRPDVAPEWIGMARQIQVELLPHERAALLKWNFASDEVRKQLEARKSSSDVESMTFTATDVRWLASDLTHAIVKRGCRDQDIIDLSERLDYIDETSDGSLDRWY